jgi:hypothetical protein
MTKPQIIVNKTIEVKSIELAVGIDIHNHSEIVKSRGNFAQRVLARTPKWPIFDFIHEKLTERVNEEVAKQIEARLKKDIEEKINNELLSKLREEALVQIKEQLKAEGIEATVTVSID